MKIQQSGCSARELYQQGNPLEKFVANLYIHTIVSLYRDRPYRGLKDVVAKTPLDLSFEYERVRAI